MTNRAAGSKHIERRFFFSQSPRRRKKRLGSVIMEGTPAVTKTYDTMELEEEGGTNGHRKKNGTAAGEDDAHRDRSVEIWQSFFMSIRKINRIFARSMNYTTITCRRYPLEDQNIPDLPTSPASSACSSSSCSRSCPAASLLTRCRCCRTSGSPTTLRTGARGRRRSGNRWRWTVSPVFLCTNLNWI